MNLVPWLQLICYYSESQEVGRRRGSGVEGWRGWRWGEGMEGVLQLKPTTVSHAKRVARTGLRALGECTHFPNSAIMQSEGHLLCA